MLSLGLGLHLGSRRALYGPNLVLNGGFDTADDWVLGSWTIGGGVATCAGGNASLIYALTSESGATYRASVEITAYTSGQLACAVGAGYSEQVLVPMTVQVHEFDIIGGSNTAKGIEFYGGSFIGSIDNVTMRKIL